MPAARSATPRGAIAAARRVEALRASIRDADYKYYVLDAPDVSDAEYDAWMRELAELEAADPDLASPDSPTQRVGGAPSDAFDAVTHRLPMLSLNNAFADADVEAFDQLKLAAKRMAHTLGGELVDDNQRPLTDTALAAIRSQVVGASELLVRAQIEPGSPRAHKLFSA